MHNFLQLLTLFSTLRERSPNHLPVTRDETADRTHFQGIPIIHKDSIPVADVPLFMDRNRSPMPNSPFIRETIQTSAPLPNVPIIPDTNSQTRIPLSDTPAIRNTNRHGSISIPDIPLIRNTHRQASVPEVNMPFVQKKNRHFPRRTIPFSSIATNFLMRRNIKKDADIKNNVRDILNEHKVKPPPFFNLENERNVRKTVKNKPEKFNEKEDRANSGFVNRFTDPRGFKNLIAEADIASTPAIPRLPPLLPPGNIPIGLLIPSGPTRSRDVPVKCSIPCPRPTHCPYGYMQEDCPRCRCAPDPCAGKKCRTLLEKCIHVPNENCIDETRATCPYYHVCEEIKCGCSNIWQPVCGTDTDLYVKTYINECVMECNKSVTKLYDGECWPLQLEKFFFEMHENKTKEKIVKKIQKSFEQVTFIHEDMYTSTTGLPVTSKKESNIHLSNEQQIRTFIVKNGNSNKRKTALEMLSSENSTQAHTLQKNIGLTESGNLDSSAASNVPSFRRFQNTLRLTKNNHNRKHKDSDSEHMFLDLTNYLNTTVS